MYVPIYKNVFMYNINLYMYIHIIGMYVILCMYECINVCINKLCES